MNRPVGSRVTARNGSKSKTVQVKEFIKQRIIDGRSPNGSRISSNGNWRPMCRQPPDRSSSHRRLGKRGVPDPGPGKRHICPYGLAGGGRQFPSRHSRCGGSGSQHPDGLLCQPDPQHRRSPIPAFLPHDLANCERSPRRKTSAWPMLNGTESARLIICWSQSFGNHYCHNMKVRGLPFVLLDSHVQGVDADLGAYRQCRERIQGHPGAECRGVQEDPRFSAAISPHGLRANACSAVKGLVGASMPLDTT